MDNDVLYYLVERFQKTFVISREKREYPSNLTAVDTYQSIQISRIFRYHSIG